MQLPDKLQDALRKMTYATQFSHPMVAGVERTMSVIVWPLLYKFSPEQYLMEITSLLKSQCTLSQDIFTEQRTDKEVREYLEALALGIEEEFKEVGRSNSVVSKSGVWQCMEYPKNEIRLGEGQRLPMVDEQVFTWKLVQQSNFASAYDALVHELATYYNKKSMRNTFDMKDVEECVKFSAKRIDAILPQAQRILLAECLEDIGSNSRSSQMEEIKKATSIDWAGNRESWEFFLKFTSLLAAEMRNSFH